MKTETVPRGYAELSLVHRRTEASMRSKDHDEGLTKKQANAAKDQGETRVVKRKDTQ